MTTCTPADRERIIEAYAAPRRALGITGTTTAGETRLFDLPSQAQIARQYGVTPQYVSALVRRGQYLRVPKRRRCPLTLEQQAMIVLRYCLGWRHTAITLRYNVSRETTLKLVKRAGVPLRQPHGTGER